MTVSLVHVCTVHHLLFQLGQSALVSAAEVQYCPAGTEGTGVYAWMSVLYANHWTPHLPEYRVSHPQSHQQHLGKISFADQVAEGWTRH